MSDQLGEYPCINCLHRSHLGKECPYCPLPSKENPNARCREYVRADIFTARSLARLEQFLAQSHGQLFMALSAMFDLMQEAYPEAAQKLREALETRQKAAEAEMELQRAKALAEADEALKAANDAEERRRTEELVSSYKDNVIPFPVASEVMTEENPDKDEA